MKTTVQHVLLAISDYSRFPNGVLQIENLAIGAFKLGAANVVGREAAITLHEYIQEALRSKHRVASLKAGHRQPECLDFGTPARPLEVEIAHYLKDLERRDHRPATIQATRRTLKLLLLTCGNISASRVGYDHIHRLWELLRWVPKNFVSDPKYMDFSYDQAIAAGQADDTPPPARATQEKHRRFLTAFFNFLHAAGAIPHSPMKAFKPIAADYTVDKQKVIRYYTDEELARIFNPDTFTSWAFTPHRWWAPLIAVYTGARINEIAQLKLVDIEQRAGVWCFVLQKTEDADLAANPRAKRTSRQSLKGSGCMRVIPIAQALIHAGFLDYLADVQACGHPRLFPQLSAGVNRATKETNARYSQQLVIDFGRYMKTLDFPEGLGFHAFRHTLATELDVLGIPERDIALITGHSTDKREHVQVLRDHYLHKRSDVSLSKQVKAIEQYKPNLVLPKYVRGQFALWLEDPKTFKP